MSSVLKFGKVAGVALALLGGHAYATTTQGALGATSTGTQDVKLLVPDLVQVSNLNELNLGTYSPLIAPATSDDLCVYRRGASAGDYVLTLTSANQGGGTSFQMVSGANLLPYTVKYEKIDGSAQVTPASGTTISRFSEANNQSISCTTGTLTNTIRVSVTQVDADAAKAGSYMDTLTLLVAPL